MPDSRLGGFCLLLRRALAITILVFCPLTGASLAQTRHRGVQVRHSGREVFESSPQKLVTSALNVTNTTEQGLEFMPELVLPEGWKSITPLVPFHVGPGATHATLLSVHIPQTAAARDYEIMYRVSCVRDPLITDYATIHVRVLSVTNLQLTLSRAPERVFAGESFTAVFLINNASNTESNIVFQGLSGRDLPLTLVPEALSLAPGESGSVIVHVTTDGTESEGFVHHLKLRATSADNEKVLGVGSCSVQIVSRVTGGEETFFKIPAEIHLRTIGQKRSSQHTDRSEIRFQGEFRGGGTINGDSERTIEWQFLGPDTLSSGSMFGLREMYSASFQGRNAMVLLGDGSYSLSPLTERFLDGRGVQASFGAGNARFGGYNTKPRSSAKDLRETALWIDYSFGDGLGFGVNLLEKNIAGQRSRIASIEGGLSVFDHSIIDVEVAFSDNGQGHDAAHRFNLYGDRSRLGYRLEYVHADPNFPGYYRDREYVSLNLSFLLNENMSLNAAFRQNKDNLDLDITQGTAPLQGYGVLGLTYAFPSGTSVYLEAQYRHREDRLPDPSYEDQDSTVKMRLTRSFKRFFFNVSAEFGKSRDRLSDEIGNVSMFEGGAYWRPAPNQSYGGYARYTDGASQSAAQTRSIDAGLSGSLRIANGLEIAANLNAFDDLSPVSRDRYTLDLRIARQLTNNWTASLRGRHTVSTGGRNGPGRNNNTEFLLELTIPFRLPIARKPGISSIEGIVHDLETGSPIPDAVLRINNATAVTDRDGSFTFPGLEPGAYLLRVDRASIGLRKITMQKMPMDVEIDKDGRHPSLEIGVTNSSSIVGRLTTYDFTETGGLKGTLNPCNTNGGSQESENDEDVVEAGGLNNVVVEFSNSTTTLRVLTDKMGRFRFDDIRPGPATITVHADNLPRYHYLEHESLDLDLAPGSKQELLIRVLPRRRRIQMLTPAQTIVEEKPPADAPSSDHLDRSPRSTPLVDSEPVPDAKPETNAPAFAVQLASYRSRTEAFKAAETYRAELGHPSRVIEVELHSRGVWYRVLVGEFSTAAEAERFRSNLANEAKIDIGPITLVSPRSQTAP